MDPGLGEPGHAATPWATQPLSQVVPRAGFEPATYRLGGDCSIQLSYRGHGIDRMNPNAITNQLGRMVEPRGVEPLTSRVRF